MRLPFESLQAYPVTHKAVLKSKIRWEQFHHNLCLLSLYLRLTRRHPLTARFYQPLRLQIRNDDTSHLLVNTVDRSLRASLVQEIASDTFNRRTKRLLIEQSTYASFAEKNTGVRTL
jgi:hypothetical protein